jgi:hypothetical protein
MKPNATKTEIAEELTMSLSTLQRRLKAFELVVPRGLVSEDKQKEIYHKLGVSDNSKNKPS